MRSRSAWLNRTVLGVGVASFFGDLSHESATALLPLLAADLGGAAAVLGAMEGLSDAASGFAKIWSGWVTDRLHRRKPLALAGYLATAIFTSLLGGVTAAWQAVATRALAWAGRGLRSPPRSSLLADDVDAAHYGKAFGVERALDTLGAIAGPLAAAALVASIPYRAVLWATLIPGLLAAAAIAFLVRERVRHHVRPRPFLGAVRELPGAYRSFLLAVGLFGIGDFAHTLLILRAIEVLEPSMGRPRASSVAIGLYALHNVAGAVTALLFGAAADRFGRARTLALSYLLGPLMLLALILLPASAAERGPLPVMLLLGFVFVLGGALLGAEETLESAAAAEMLPPDRRGMGFGTLAAVNSGGDLVSSAAVGALWQILGPRAAFGIALGPMMAGSLLLFWGAPRSRSAPSRG